jgi:hypothetical protein
VCVKPSNLTFSAGSDISTLGALAFEGCSSLREICVPSSVHRVCHSCFRNFQNLSSLTFEPDCHISHLGESAFSSCASLQSICIPASVETIAPSCFQNWERLVNIVLDAGCKLSAEAVEDLCSTFQFALT